MAKRFLTSTLGLTLAAPGIVVLWAVHPLVAMAVALAIPYAVHLGYTRKETHRVKQNY